jgi:uncharacterized caspase-like protein
MMMRRSVFAAALVVLAGAFVAGCGVPGAYAPRGMAIVYGIAWYEDAVPQTYQPNLAVTDDDATAMAQLLEDQGYDVVLRLDEEATKTQLAEDFAAAAESIRREGGNLVFYFSGHGGQGDDYRYDSSGSEPTGGDDQDEVLVLHGAATRDGPWFPVELHPELMLSDDELAELLSTVPADHRIVVLDACRSGGFIGEGFAVDDLPPELAPGSSYWTNDAEGTATGGSILQRAYELYLNGADRTKDIGSDRALVIAASGEQEDAYEDTRFLDHGIFTYFLLESAREGDANGDGYVTALEAYRYAGTRTTEFSTNVPGFWPYAPHVSAATVDPVFFVVSN